MKEVMSGILLPDENLRKVNNNTENFLEEEAFELAFKGDEGSREPSLLERLGFGRRCSSLRGAVWTRQEGEGREKWARPARGVTAGLLGFRRKSQGRQSSGPGDGRGWLQMALTFLSNLCLSWRLLTELLRLRGVPGGSFYVLVIILSPTKKIILSWEEGRFGVLKTAAAEVRAA